MTDPIPEKPEHDVLPPEPGGALSVPPPVPQKQPGFLRRLFMSRRKQQALAMQNGYLEMVDLIRAIRSHLDRQETVQTTVLNMLAKVPDAMDRQHEVMTMFKQQLESGMENNRRLTDSMGNLNNTLASIDESQRASSRTITDLIGRSRESEQLLREVMRRSERRMTGLLVLFFLLVAGLGWFFYRSANQKEFIPARTPKPDAAAPAVITKAAEPQKAVAPQKDVKKAEIEATKGEKTPEAKVESEKTAETAVKAASDAEKKASEQVTEPKKAEKTEMEAKKEEKAPAADVTEEKKAEKTAKKGKSAEKTKEKAKPTAKAGEKAAEATPPVASDDAPAVGQPDLTLDQIKQVVGEIGETSSPVPPEQSPVSRP